MRAVPPWLVVLSCAMAATASTTIADWEQEWSLANQECARRLEQRDFAAAERSAVAALALARRLGKESRQSAIRLNSLGSVYRHLARYDRAERCYREAASIWATLPNGDGLGLVTVLSNLSQLYIEARRLPEAEATLRKSRQIQLDDSPPARVQEVVRCEQMAIVATWQRRFGEAEPLARKLVLMSVRIYGRTHQDTGIAWNQLGILHLAMKRPAEALEEFLEARRIIEQTLGPEDPNIIAVLANLGLAYTRLGELEKAEALFSRATRMADRTFGPAHIRTANILLQYAELLQALRRKAEARQVRARCRSIFAASAAAAMGHTVSVTELPDH